MPLLDRLDTEPLPNRPDLKYWTLTDGSGLGPWLLHNAYDGLGRLIRKQVPAGTDNLNPPIVRSEHFYYDGSRRIQEQVFEPLTMPAAGGGNGKAAGVQQELVLAIGQGLPGAIQREFVHAPGYVDRLVCLYSGEGPGGGGTFNGGNAGSDPLYVLQDASYTVTGLVNQSGGVVEQYRYDPYGRVIEVGNPTPWPNTHRRNAVGHQGLFFDRLEATGPGANGAGGPQLLAAAPVNTLQPWATPPADLNPRGLYQNRNRTLDPVLGRFLQRDPNASGVMVASVELTPLLGNPITVFDSDSRLHDSLSLYQYTQSNPFTFRDPMGLETGDDAIAALFEQSLSVIDVLGKAKAAALDSVRRVAAYVALATEFSNLIIDRDIGIVGSLAGGALLSRACFSAGTRVTLDDGSLTPIECVELGDRVWSRDEASSSQNNSSVLAATSATSQNLSDDSIYEVSLTLDTILNGKLTARLLRSRSWVLAEGAAPGATLLLDLEGYGLTQSGVIDEVTLLPNVVQSSIRRGSVTGVYVTEQAKRARLWINSVGPIDTTESHLFYSADRDAWVQAQDLRVGECLASLDKPVYVHRVDLTEERSKVYNIEVEGSHEYFVGDRQVLVHNTCDVNRLNHIFGQARHRLGPLLKAFGGNARLAFEAVEAAAGPLARTAENTREGFYVVVRGFTVRVRGTFVEGEFRISTFFIEP